jgi:MHS family proline/betaine transporter-like MFS transporter
MTSYGWRIAFFLVVPLTVIAFVVRTRLEDSPEFTEMVKRKKVVKAPVREVFGRYWRQMLVAGGVAIAANGASGMGLWFTTLLAGTRKLPASDVFLATAIGYFVGAALVPLFGHLTDRYGQRRVGASVLGAFVVVVVPVLWVLTTTTTLGGLVLGLSVYIILGAIVQPPCYSFIAERFPVQVRFTGATFAQNIGTVLASGPAPLVAGLLLSSTGVWAAPALWIVLVCGIGFVAFAVSRRVGTDPADDAPARPEPIADPAG